MNLYQRLYHNILLRPMSWKNAARFNCIVLAFFVFPLLILTILSRVKSTNHSQFLMLPEGNCKHVSMANKGLHLVLNVVSSLVLASSNFFMQILNAPNRSEVDRAHRKGTWLEIGVPSIRNTFRVSWFKSFFWVILFMSSVPIHLVFNSAVFQVDTISDTLSMTVASEAFLEGASYFVPGASLSAMQTYEYGWAYWTGNKTLNGTVDFFATFSEANPESLTAYSTNASAAVKTGLLQRPKSHWDRLSAEDCYHKYADYNCSGIRTHKDVVVILNEPLGWTRNETWGLEVDQTAFWDQVIPAAQKNSLWYFSNCTMSTSGYAGNMCGCSCLGFPFDTTEPRAWITDSLRPGVSWEGQRNTFSTDDAYQGTLRIDPSRLQVSHCWAEPWEQPCRIGISTTLLLTVLVCVVVKAAAALAVTWKLSHQPDESLITIGDALASFIRAPDASTRGMSACGHEEALSMIANTPLGRTASHPREWCKPQKKRLGALIKRRVWATSYTLINFGIIFAVSWILFATLPYSGAPLEGTFGPSEKNPIIEIPFSFVTAVLLANCPQILLSFCYLVYNQLFTRLLSAIEISKYGKGFWPLRVTDPEGLQYSTYRLQLPYKYSIPLIIASIVLHWLLSNSLYLMASGGNYVKPNEPYDDTLPFPIAISVGYSVIAGIVLCVVSVVVSMAPIVLAFRKLPSGMNNMGNNSLALSAACHASTLSAAVKHHRPSAASHLSFYLKALSASNRELTPSNHDSESAISRHGSDENHPNISRDDSTRPFLSSTYEPDTEKTLLREEQTLLNVSRSRIRWGVIRMPPEWYKDYETSVVPVEHLGFGVEEDGVEPPVNGKYYA